MYQFVILIQELDTRDELGFGDEMVLVKMLMEIPSPDERSVGDDVGDDFPLWREVSPAEQLCQSPRLVPPRFRLVAAESRPERLPSIFFSSKDFI